MLSLAQLSPSLFCWFYWMDISILHFYQLRIFVFSILGKFRMKSAVLKVIALFSLLLITCYLLLFLTCYLLLHAIYFFLFGILYPLSTKHWNSSIPHQAFKHSVNLAESQTELSTDQLQLVFFILLNWLQRLVSGPYQLYTTIIHHVIKMLEI